MNKIFIVTQKIPKDDIVTDIFVVVSDRLNHVVGELSKVNVRAVNWDLTIVELGNTNKECGVIIKSLSLLK